MTMTTRPDPIAMNATTIVLLPHATGADATCLRIDADGRVLSRHRPDVDSPLTASPAQPVVRQLLAVPGSECLSCWLDLPARNPVQALAAARVLVAAHVAGPIDTLHLAIAPMAADGGSRQVVAIESATMQAWLDRATALGMTPDAVVPLPMLLPPPEPPAAGTTSEVVVAEIDGHWLVRGEQLAFAAEPALAEQIIGDRPRRLLTAADAESAFAANALMPPIDLLQYAFARQSTHRQGWPAYRRAAILAAVLAVSPLVLLTAQAIRYELAARALQSQTAALARTLMPTLEEGANPLPPIRARLAEFQAGGGFAHATATLLAAVAATDGAELDALSYAGGELQATLVVPSPPALEQIRGALFDAGLELTENDGGKTNGRSRYTITVRTSA